MESPRVVSSLLLLIWILTLSRTSAHIRVSTTEDGIRVTCETEGFALFRNNKPYLTDLPFKDETSGEYVCENNVTKDTYSLHVLFKTCDNCIDLDPLTLVGLTVGEVVMTLLVGVSVYLLATASSQSRPVASDRTGSDRNHMVPADRNKGGATNEHYQRLRFKHGDQKDEYGILKNRR